jgi:hypothetical protein
MRFKASENLVDLFVGQLVYTSPATPVRELLQNACDACALQSVDHSEFKPLIQAKISRSGNWFEVDDNGIGMDRSIVEESFSMVGRPKTEIPTIGELIRRGGLQAAQIATFGVGVLSCFRVAQKAIVSTKMNEKEPLKFIIENPRKDFIEVNEGLRDVRGTSVKVEIRSSVGFAANDAYNAIFQFARHIEGLKVVDVDVSKIQDVFQEYDGEKYPVKTTLRNDDIRYGVFALNESWESLTGQWTNNIRLDNAGFLVMNHDPSMLPAYCFGYTAEIDFMPQRLQLMVNRESFVQDQKYNSERNLLLEEYLKLVKNKITGWASRISQGDKDALSKQVVKENLLTLDHNLPVDSKTQSFRSFVTDFIEKNVEFDLYGPSTRPITLEEAKHSMGSTFYIYNPARGGAQQVTEAFDEETTLQITRQTLTYEKIKASILSLQGKPVFLVSLHNKPVNTPTGSYSLGYDTVAFLNRYCQTRNLRLIDITQVPESEIRLQDTKLTDLMGTILDYGKLLKFMNLKDIKRPTFRDVDGSHWVNIASPEVRNLVKSIPDMVGNPIKMELLLIYFDLLTTDFTSAKKKIENLLLNKDFEELSRQKTGVFQERYLRKIITEITDTEAIGDK